MEEKQVTSPALGLFQGFGFELEYMIVDRGTLAVRPFADRVLRDSTGRVTDELEQGRIAWSNELVMHVIELKTNGPVPGYDRLGETFSDSVRHLNRMLEPYDAMLLPTGMHPFMDPARETALWPYEGREIYRAYDRIFNCRRHGWANLQSIHLNLPFADDREFARLHAAVRLVLPIIPALAASTPLVEGRLSGVADTRLEAYRANQAMVPSISGLVVPEALFSRAAYEEGILAKISRDIAPCDPEGVFKSEWLNSRGAIARFDRNTIEIRLIDIQECPAMDIAVSAAVICAVRALAEERFAPACRQMERDTDSLAAILAGVIREGERFLIRDQGYLDMFDAGSREMDAGELIRMLVSRLAGLYGEMAAHLPALELIGAHGTLSSRIVRSLGGDVSRESIDRVYRALARCLNDNTAFLP